MAESDQPPFRMPDPALVSRTMADVAERSQRIVADFLKRQSDNPAEPDPMCPDHGPDTLRYLVRHRQHLGMAA